ncbi:MAG TPA: DNA polymerase I [Candidatus Cryptobacteroides pullicola]|nr:DNA polymerase I [Candidatus Cryptobacteroides pullicola]
MKLFLIDGHALIFKMYYAFLGRPMVNSRGEDVSILFGFVKYLLEMLESERPTHVGVSFDPPGGTFRNELYPPYKANRGETPQLVIDALDPLREIVSAMRIPVLMVPGFEADDTIGSAAVRFASDDMDIYMVTPDKDYGQLVTEHIFQYRPGKSGSDNEILGPREVCDKWKIASCSQVIDILALCGDSSDNVPGVQGIGPVGASKLLAKYGSLEGVYAHIEDLTPRQKHSLEAARDYIFLSKKLVTIRTDVPFGTGLEELVFDTAYTPDIDSLLDRYEFPSLKKLLRRLCCGAAGSPAPAAGMQSEAGTPASVLIPECRLADASLIRPGRVAVELCGEMLRVCDGVSVAEGRPEDFRDLMEDAATVKAGCSLKAVVNFLARRGISLEGRLEDVELLHYLLNPERSHKLEDLALNYLGLDIDGGAGRSEEPASLFDAGSDDAAGTDSFLRVRLLLPLADMLIRELRAGDGILAGLYDRIEEPLIRVLSSMELAGVKIDLDSLDDFASSLRSRMLEREKQIRDLAGEPELNIMSPRQIGTVIFEKLRLDPAARKPRKGSWPTDEQTLSELSGRSPIIEAILDYRALKKLLSTYIEPFAGYVSPGDGRVHTTFNQALTSTGRLSSSNPNLQNIPIRTDLGREIRRAFVPGAPDRVLMSADYSQIELRMMAHMSGDEHLIAAFNAEQDIHAATASKIFSVPVEEVSPDMRRIAKTANFGIMYGISSFGLSQRLHCGRDEARKIIDGYFASFPSIRNFIDSTLRFARENGYVETLFGRRRYIADINSRNGSVRAIAERNAVNAPVQGSAADIIKLAMIAVDSALGKEGLRSKMILQIHDELLLEVPLDELERVREILIREMEGVTELSVPLTVECNYGKNWLDAH